MHKIIFSSLMLASAGASLTCQAETNAETDNLSEIVVTATRTETDKTELASAVTVITRSDIERRQVRTLPELLKGSTGLDVVQTGGYGQPASVYMRGAEASHILVLIDGIKAGSVTLGSTAFELIPVDQIERIEIIRGPQSSLYGSEAIGGVIQIFTRKGKQSEKPSISAQAGGGSYDTHQESGTISGRVQNSWYSLGASNLDSQGFGAKLTPPAGPNPNGYGYRNTAVNAKAGHRFDNNAEVDAFFMRAEGTNQFDRFSAFFPQFDPNKREYVNQVVGTSLSMDILQNWRSNLRLGQTEDQQTSLLTSGAFSSRFNTTRWNASWLNQFSFNKNHQLTLGSDYRYDEVESSIRFNKTSRYDVGVFGELHSRIFDSHYVNASVRWDENQAFGNAVTGSLGWRFNWDHGLSVFANFGNAFKAPTFNDLYYPGYGNANLQPETSISYETGLAGKHDWGNWELRAYHTEIDNLITPVSVAGIYTATNIGKSQIEGIEAELSTQLLGWTNKLTGSLLDPRNLGTNNLLPRRSQQTFSYEVSRSFDAFDVGGSILAQAGRFDDVANTKRLGGFITLDLRTAYHIDKNWMLSAKLNNMLDKQYQVLNGFTTFGRNFFLTIHYSY